MSPCESGDKCYVSVCGRRQVLYLCVSQDTSVMSPCESGDKCYVSVHITVLCTQFTPAEKRVETGDKWHLDRLCQYIYTKDSTDRIRTRAMLCQIYHHALHDRYSHIYTL